MFDPGVSRRVQVGVLTIALGALATNAVHDLYELTRGTLKEVATVPAPVEKVGELVLSVVPLSRRVERERIFLFFHRRTYLTTYRVELENRDLESARGGRLVVSSSAGRVLAFEAHALLDPDSATGGAAGIRHESTTFAAAPQTFAIDLRLPPPGAVLGATVTIGERGQHVAEQDLVLELGHDGGVLRATPVPVVWDDSR